MRQKIIIANWKMYKTINEGTNFVRELKSHFPESSIGIYLAVPFTMINACSQAAQNSSIVIGAQNMNDASEGAFTGEIAAKMLKDAGAKFVLIGHSERRTLFKEDDAFINRKVKKSLSEKLQTVLCVGESLEEREKGQTSAVLEKQLIHGLEGLESKDLEHCILAYEPVWAIGTGRSATAQLAQETQHLCREIIRKKWGAESSNRIPILYGGSVKPENSGELVQQPDIDGLLVGGASLSMASFTQIINNCRSMVTK